MTEQNVSPEGIDLIAAELEALLSKVTPHDQHLVLTRYDHGGGRMFRELPPSGFRSGDRTLIIDAYHEGDREFYFNVVPLVRKLLAIVRLPRVEGGREEVMSHAELQRSQPDDSSVPPDKSGEGGAFVTTPTQAIIADSAKEQPTTQGDPPPQDGWHPIATMDTHGKRVIVDVKEPEAASGVFEASRRGNSVYVPALGRDVDLEHIRGWMPFPLTNGTAAHQH